MYGTDESSKSQGRSGKRNRIAEKWIGFDSYGRGDVYHIIVAISLTRFWMTLPYRVIMLKTKLLLKKWIKRYEKMENSRRWAEISKSSRFVLYLFIFLLYFFFIAVFKVVVLKTFEFMPSEQFHLILCVRVP